MSMEAVIAASATIAFSDSPPTPTVEVVPGVPGAFEVINLLSTEECTLFVALADQLGFEPYCQHGALHGAVTRLYDQFLQRSSSHLAKATPQDLQERVNVEAPPQISAELNRRLQPCLPSTLECDGRLWELVTVGTHLAQAPLNSKWRFNRYKAGSLTLPISLRSA